MDGEGFVAGGEAEGKMEGTRVAESGVAGGADGGIGEMLIVLEVGTDPPILAALTGPVSDGLFEIGSQFPGQGAVAAFKGEAEIGAFVNFNAALPGLEVAVLRIRSDGAWNVP